MWSESSKIFRKVMHSVQCGTNTTSSSPMPQIFYSCRSSKSSIRFVSNFKREELESPVGIDSYRAWFICNFPRQIKAPEWLQIVWCKGGVNQIASTPKTVAALEVFENPCTPAVAYKKNFRHCLINSIKCSISSHTPRIFM